MDNKKKNLIAQAAKYQNISLMHDYVALRPNWYDNFIEFGEDWDVCMTRIENQDGKRFRDWMSWDNFGFIDYDDNTKTKEMYVSGTYFCIKKDFFINHPLDERLSWGEGEDVEWSKSVRNIWNYRCNYKSVVRFIKYKNHFPQLSSEEENQGFARKR